MNKFKHYINEFLKFFVIQKSVEIKEFELTKAIISVYWKNQPYIFNKTDQLVHYLYGVDGHYEPSIDKAEHQVNKFLKAGRFKIKSTINSYEVIYKEQLTAPIKVEYTTYKKKFRRTRTSLLGYVTYTEYIDV